MQWGELTDASSQRRVAIDTEKHGQSPMHTSTWQLARLVSRRGHIALQIHGGTQRWAKDAKCRWRNIKFRPVAEG